jgi:hypothetical protein
VTAMKFALLDQTIALAQRGQQTKTIAMWSA